MSNHTHPSLSDPLHVSAARCGTMTALCRADRLSLNDQILVAHVGGVRVQTITSLALDGDDVEIETGTETFSTSIGHTFQVVNQRAS
jgi:hypothetical protein